MSNSSDQTRKYGSLLFITALAVLFALQWGPGSQGCDVRMQDPEVVASVNGKSILVKDFARSYAQQAENFRRQGLPNDMIKQFGVDKQVLDQLVNTELLSQAAEARGLTTSDRDIAKVLKDAPAFQKDGRFDKEQYLAYVQQFEGITEIQFQEKLRRQLSAQKLLDLVESSVTVSEDEVKAKYLKDGDVAKVSFVRFLPAMYSDKVTAPKPAEIDAWMRVNEPAIAEHYEKNKFTYFVQEKVKAKQIVLRVPPDADDAKKAEVKARAEAVRKQLVDEKKDFSELAKAVSEDVGTREQGGDLGFVDRQLLSGPFADVLFALKEGEVSIPVETPAGWFIGTVLEKKSAEQRSLDSVRKDIALQLLVKEKARALAAVDADKALAALKGGKTLTEQFPAAPSESGNSFAFAAETKPEAKDTGEFNSSADAIPQLGADPALKKAIFALKAPGNLDTVMTVGDALVVATVDVRKSPSDADFDTQKAQLTVEAIKGKQFEVRESFLKSLKQSASVTQFDQVIAKVTNDT